MNDKQEPTSLNKFFSVQRLAYVLIIATLLTYFIIAAKSIIIPITFAFFFAFMLKPIQTYISKYISNDPLSIFLSFITILIPLSGIIYLLTIQVYIVFEDLPSIGDQMKEGINQTMRWVKLKARDSGIVDRSAVDDGISKFVDGIISFVSGGINATPSAVISFFITFIYTFFLLYYKDGLKNFFVAQFPQTRQEEVKKTMSKVQNVAQKYLYGLGFVILIMGLLNSLGLFLIGIDFPVLWGFLAAFLTVIPYAGTAIGGLLPFIFAVATTDTTWQPVAVLLYYMFIQFIEGNLITPRVIGNSVSINAMAAILALLIGGSIWGIAGVVLALPIIATIRIIFYEIDSLKPVALLLSNDLNNKEEKFKDGFNKDKFRLSSIFKIKRSSIKWRK